MAKKNCSGRIVRPAKNGLTKVVQTQARWGEDSEERFLDVLAETCNVTAAAGAAGFSTTALYRRRARWPGFAAEWDAAVAQGYARLEARLVELATDSLRPREVPDPEPDDDGDAPPDAAKNPAKTPATPPTTAPAMTIAEAMNLLRLHRASVRGGAPQRYGWRKAAPDPDAMRASILRKIDAIERADEQADAPTGEAAASSEPT